VRECYLDFGGVGADFVAESGGGVDDDEFFDIAAEHGLRGSEDGSEELEDEV
jgi:hypothetical protein